MKRSREIQMQSPAAIVQKWRRRKLALACLVIAACFALGNDMYRAKAVVVKNKDLFPGQKKVISYLDAKKAHIASALFRTDSKRRYLIDPIHNVQPTMLKALTGGTDTCANATPITALPYSDSGTTVGFADNYDIPTAPFSGPSPAGCPACVANGFPSGGRGTSFIGTGTGPDVAYGINFSTTGNLSVTLTPTSYVAYDPALIVYTSVCSSSLNDAIVVSDHDPSDATPEVVTITGMPAGRYNIVVDGYTYNAGAPGATSSGTYTLNVTNEASSAVVQPAILISGKILRADGVTPLRNTTVTLTDSHNNVTTTASGAFGDYQFTNIKLGETYRIDVASKHYRFLSQTGLTFTGNVSGLNFVGDE